MWLLLPFLRKCSHTKLQFCVCMQTNLWTEMHEWSKVFLVVYCWHLKSRLNFYLYKWPTNGPVVPLFVSECDPRVESGLRQNCDCVIMFNVNVVLSVFSFAFVRPGCWATLDETLSALSDVWVYNVGWARHMAPSDILRTRIDTVPQHQR